MNCILKEAQEQARFRHEGNRSLGTVPTETSNPRLHLTQSCRITEIETQKYRHTQLLLFTQNFHKVMRRSHNIAQFQGVKQGGSNSYIYTEKRSR